MIATLAALAVLLVIIALGGWWLFLSADREGIAPTNHIDELNREDGGPGPI